MDQATDTASKSPKHPAYEDETKRFETFRNQSYLWPEHLPQKPEDLAHAGFVYKGYGDEVFCFWCDGALCRWEEEDIPLVEHAKHFPNCEYIKKIYIEKKQGDDPSLNRTSQDDPNLTSTKQDTDTASISPKHPAYEDETKRLKTFTDKFSLLNKRLSQKPSDLAHAGFFYFGNIVHCFWCDGKVFTWEDEDVPLVKHARLFPDCEYIRKIYISKIQGNYYSHRNKDKQGGQQDENADEPDLFLLPHVLECLQCGYTREEIQAVFDEYDSVTS